MDGWMDDTWIDRWVRDRWMDDCSVIGGWVIGDD